MNFILFLILSIIEAFSVFVFSLKMYRFDIKDFKFSIILSSIILSIISYFLRSETELAGYDIFIQLIVFGMLVGVLFRIPIFYAYLIGITGYAGNIIIQMGLYILMVSLNIIDDSELSKETSIYTIILQSISVCLTFISAWIFHKLHIGFSFIPHGETAKLKDSKLLLIATSISIFIFGTCFYIYKYYDNSNYSIGLAVLGISIILLIVGYFSVKKETE